MNHAIQAGARVRFIRSYPYPGGEIPSGTEGRVAYVVRTSFLLGRHEASVYLNKRRLHGIDVHPRVVTGAHPPLVTESQWQAANAVEGAFYPRTQTLALQAGLRGLVWCADGHRLKVGGYGKPGQRKATYCCTAPGCSARASIRASRLDAHVEHLLTLAASEHEPHVAAVIEGGTAYADALAAVEDAQRLHDEVRDSVELQRELGIRDWTAALRVRRDALALARRELSAVRPPSSNGRRDGRLVKFEDFIQTHEYEWRASLLDRVVVRPSPNGRSGQRVDPSERADVYLAGASEPYRPRYPKLPRRLRASLPS